MKKAIFLLMIVFLSMTAHAGLLEWFSSLFNSPIEPQEGISISNNTVNFLFKNKELNITPGAIINNQQYEIQQYLTCWTGRQDNHDKWGCNVTIPDSDLGGQIANNLQEINFRLDANFDLRKIKNGFSVLTQTYKEGNIIKREYINYDFSDIDSYYAERNITIPRSIDKENRMVRYDVSGFSFSRGQTIFFDPTIEIINVSDYDSVDTNIQKEPYPFSHIALNDSSLILYMPFDMDNRTGKIYDWSGYNNDGTAYGDTNWTYSGYIGGGYSFDGEGDYVSLGSVYTNEEIQANGLTLSAWVYQSMADSPDQHIVGGEGATNHAGWSAGGLLIDRITVNNFAAMEVYDGAYKTIFGTTDLVEGTWYHLVGVIDPSTSQAIIYVNGVNESNYTLNIAGISFDATYTYIGTRIQTTPIESFNGTIDEVMIFNRSLSADEIATLYNFQLSKFYQPATMEFKIENIHQNGSLNRINITTNTSQINGSNITLNLEEISINNYSVSSLPQQPNLWFQFDNLISKGENASKAVNFGNETYNLTCNVGTSVCPVAVNSTGGFFGSFRYDGDADKWHGIDDDYIDELSIAVWINVTEPLAGNNYIVGKFDGTLGNGEWVFNTDHNSQAFLEFNCGGTIDASADAFPQNEWHFVGMTFNQGSGQIQWYLDGENFENDTTSDTCLIDDTELTIVGGSGEGSNSNDFNGEIDDLMVFEKVLTSEEMKQIYTTGGFDGTKKTEDISHGVNQIKNMSINTDAYYVSLEFNFTGNAFNSYSPILYDNIMIESYDQQTEYIPDETAPVITLLTNESTTNESSIISWSCDENCNYTIQWDDDPDFSSITGTIANNTFGTTHTSFLNGLLNITSYFINLSVSDSSGNFAFNDTFNFTTAQNAPTATTCDCPASGNWTISDGSNCTLATTCDINENILHGDNGGLLINPGGKLICGGIAKADLFRFANAGNFVIN